MMYIHHFNKYQLFSCCCCWLSRFRRFLFSMGYGRDEAANYNVGEFCRMINEFALNYKIAREKVLAEFEKIKNLKKMIGEDDKVNSFNNQKN